MVSVAGGKGVNPVLPVHWALNMEAKAPESGFYWCVPTRSGQLQWSGFTNGLAGIIAMRYDARLGRQCSAPSGPLSLWVLACH